MEKLGFTLLVAGLAAAGLGGSSQAGNTPEFDYRDWTSVRSRFVDEQGQVDYGALALDRACLAGGPFGRVVPELGLTSPANEYAYLYQANDIVRTAPMNGFALNSKQR